MNARLFSALRELGDYRDEVYWKRHTSMKKLEELGFVQTRTTWISYLASYELTPAGRAKLEEMETKP